MSDYKKIDIFINGHSYGINCPASEEDNLKRAATYIQKFIQDIRKHAPNIAQDELLVLCALSLFEKSENLQQHIDQELQAKTLVEEMLNDTKKMIA